jgi:hypothetical protein
MSKSHAKLFLVTLVATLLSQSAMAAFEAECPEEVKTKQSPGPTPKGWSTHVDTVNARQIFTGLELFNGHPKDAAPLFADDPLPAPTVRKSGTEAPPVVATSDMVYKVPPGHDVYVACQYTNTIVRVIQKIPKGMQTCRVRFSETLGHVQKVVCD